VVAINTKELADKLVSWIKEQVMAAECRGVVLGMSGGLDSSVVAVLCHRAFPRNVLGVVIPCYSCQEDEDHARAVASKYSIPTRAVMLDTIYDAVVGVLPVVNSDTNNSQIVAANLKARLRMVILYYFANQLRYAVVGSGNRTELSIGYFTKYGDGGVDIMPLGGLVKGEVRELARFLGIPQEVIDKPPTAGLWPGQTDEAEIGLSYQQLDRYLLTGEAGRGIKDKIEAMIAASVHKRRLPPVAQFGDEDVARR